MNLNRVRPLCCFALGLLMCSTTLCAQFIYLGAAAPMPGGCVQFTPDEPYAEGIAYAQNKLDLTRHFEIGLDIFLGHDDLGADGITFVLHNDPRGYDAYGTYGECMGYGRWSPYSNYGDFIAPSIAVEFDTYYNPRQGDPFTDHVAYLENGSSYHETFWPSSDSLNLEDGRLHSFRFRWQPATHTVEVWLDGVRAAYVQRDLVKDIFVGATKVIWGFTASTGRKSNLQYFCLRQITQGPLPAYFYPFVLVEPIARK